MTLIRVLILQDGADFYCDHSAFRFTEGSCIWSAPFVVGTSLALAMAARREFICWARREGFEPIF